MRVITPIAISRRSAGVSGHGYKVARNLVVRVDVSTVGTYIYTMI